MNQEALANQCGVSSTTVRQWLKKGCPHRRIKSGAYHFTLTEVQRWRAEHLRTPSTEPSTYGAARARKETALAGLRELQLKEREGTLVLREAAEKAAFNAGRRIRDGMLNIPARLSGLLAAETNSQTIHDLLTKEIYQALMELSA